MNDKSTSNYSPVCGIDLCSYCHKELFLYDLVDDYGNYIGQYCQCDCEKALLEIQMNDEIEILEQEIQKTKDKYADKLQVDFKEVNKRCYEYGVQKLKSDYNIE